MYKCINLRVSVITRYYNYQTIWQPSYTHMTLSSYFQPTTSLLSITSFNELHTTLKYMHFAQRL